MSQESEKTFKHKKAALSNERRFFDVPYLRDYVFCMLRMHRTNKHLDPSIFYSEGLLLSSNGRCLSGCGSLPCYSFCADVTDSGHKFLSEYVGIAVKCNKTVSYLFDFDKLCYSI